MSLARSASGHASRRSQGQRGATNTTRASIRSPAERSADEHVGPAAIERRLRRVVAEMLGTSDGEITASIFAGGRL
jgi:hypothetical protein